MIDIFLTQANYTLFINIGILFFILLVIISQNSTPFDYEWRKRTISDLAIQGYKNAWIMRLAFITFGTLLNIGVFIKMHQTKNTDFGEVLILIHGFSMLFSGIFSTAPVGNMTPYKNFTDKFHSVLAYVAGIALTGSSLFYFFTTSNPAKIIHISFFILTLMITTLFSLSKRDVLKMDHGIIQRLLYLNGLLWIFINYNILTP
ncbi:MAG: DUF998 domain-containing protein [Candidatus Paceibacterota bacterium]